MTEVSLHGSKSVCVGNGSGMAHREKTITTTTRTNWAKSVGTNSKTQGVAAVTHLVERGALA